MRIYLSAEDPFDFDQILRIKPVLAIEPSLSRFDPDPLGSIKQTNLYLDPYISELDPDPHRHKCKFF